jgi:hypothetical protein
LRRWVMTRRDWGRGWYHLCRRMGCPKLFSARLALFAFIEGPVGWNDRRERIEQLHAEQEQELKVGDRVVEVEGVLTVPEQVMEEQRERAWLQ